MLFMLLQLSKQYTVWTNDFIKIHLINHHPQQDFILYFCLHGCDINYSDRKLPEFELNICPLFLVDNAELYTIKTRNSYNLHPPLSHLTKYQKGVHYVGIRIFNHLPSSIKSIANETK